jgi:hypothetical protein
LNFSVCARCQSEGIFETVQFCPNCGYDLGPVNPYSAPPSIAYLPTPVDRYSFMLFECKFDISLKLPFRLHGDCPAVVTSIISSINSMDGRKEKEEDFSEEGVIIDVNGPMSEWLTAFGVTPAVGDVIAMINGRCVSHLNSNQIKRLIKRIRKGTSITFPNLKEYYTISFRRHYLENLHPVDKVDDSYLKKTPVHESKTDEEGSLIVSSSSLPQVENGHSQPIHAAFEKNEGSESDGKSGDIPVPIVTRESHATVSVTQEMENIKGLIRTENEDIPPVVLAVSERTGIIASETIALPHHSSTSAADYHPICQAAAHMDISLSISKLFHESSRNIDCIPRLCNDQGNCKVQVLRSTGKWSIGTKTECSILSCYLECITNAHRFIYIENQFFISSLAGDGTQNKIVEAILERILKAHTQNEKFKIICIIPLHPNGDFANAMKSKVVMHYEYMTINRSPTSLFAQLKKRAPGINVSDYIGFYSLRNWGVLNNKVVSDQIYVHDKLMIVDDRIMIIGSANINDRSMLGSRDSEVAIRIEDTFHIDSIMNQVRHTVGYLPFTIRVKLMRQHLGNPSVGK